MKLKIGDLVHFDYREYSSSDVGIITGLEGSDFKVFWFLEELHYTYDIHDTKRMKSYFENFLKKGATKNNA